MANMKEIETIDTITVFRMCLEKFSALMYALTRIIEQGAIQNEAEDGRTTVASAARQSAVNEDSSLFEGHTESAQIVNTASTLFEYDRVIV